MRCLINALYNYCFKQAIAFEASSWGKARTRNIQKTIKKALFLMSKNENLKKMSIYS